VDALPNAEVDMKNMETNTRENFMPIASNNSNVGAKARGKRSLTRRP